MRIPADTYLSQVNKANLISHRFREVQRLLSLAVILCVFWGLKLTGITMAGDAFCGKQEHVHTEACYDSGTPCSQEEHIHEANCYSDVTADLETYEDWENSIKDIMPGAGLAEQIVQVAKSQLGVTESTRNFQVDANLVRRGITRYGQWYGNPYGDWSAMFVSFCLRYAGAERLPEAAGPETMRLRWDEQGIYQNAGRADPVAGWLVFLDKDRDGAADDVAIITEVEDGRIRVIAGDVSQGKLSNGKNSQTPGGIKTGTAPSPVKTNEIPSVATNEIPTTEATETPTEATEAPTEAPAEEVTEAPAEEISEDPPEETAEAPAELPAEPPTEDSAEEVTEEPAEVPSEEPSEEPTEAPTEAPAVEKPRENPGIGAINTIPADAVAELVYDLNDPVIMGWGMSTGAYEVMPQAPGDARYIWFDGTNGGLMALGGSANERWTTINGQTIREGNTITLPTTWRSPDKYSYVLKGWYDVTNSRYYKPGDQVKVTGNMVFYADWAAATYDIGQFNNLVTDTVSTNDFITVRMFDYGVLFNVLSEQASISSNNNSHTETWTLLTSGNNPYNGETTLNYIFRDWDKGDEDISYPRNTNDRNNPTSAGTVYSGLYTERLRTLLFDPGVQVIGKQYLGTADHLFQLCLDPSHDHYGYYYYNSERNAASYNQSAQRFYVYEYLECTRTSANSGDEGKYSDFLPLNSVYANTNGKRVNTYSYQGIEGEYVGTTHYMFDCRYNDNDNSPNYAGTNFFFGMSMEVNFFLPNAPGTGGNKDIFGNDMHFRFTGDDDVWILVDGVMMLDLGGIHASEEGDINFATGTVTINGVENADRSRELRKLTSGEHTLTLYYLERGSSMSNCALYFNLAPRFSFTIQKEDVLTRDVLNGAEFSVFMDRACTIPAELWTSKESHDRKEPSTNVFTVVDGAAHMWGMSAGQTYYIKETKPPDNTDYDGMGNGIICLTFDVYGTASYNVEILDDGAGVSPGFIVHGFRIDTETQEAYIVATNAPKWVKETTTVQALKRWNDGGDHSSQSITVYLTVTDQDGTVRRLQEAQLSSDNNWHCTWENLPKYWQDGTLIRYGVEEAYTPGYQSTVTVPEGNSFSFTQSVWQNVTRFENGKVYILQNGSGQALSTRQNAEDTGFKWIDAETAKTSTLARWVASVNGSNVRLTNEAGQTITLYYGNGSYVTDFFAWNQKKEDNDRKQYFTVNQSGGGVTFRYSNYYLSKTLNSSGKFDNTTQANQAQVFFPATETVTSVSVPITGQGYLVTNTPLDRETSLTVQKAWDYGDLTPGKLHEQAQVTIKLLADGRDTGRTVTLTLKNNWTDSFRGLPYTDENGNVIVYTVEEVWKDSDWIPVYGKIQASGGSVPTYSTTVTNRYIWSVAGPELPSTGTAARSRYILCGGGIMLTTLVYGIVSRRKRERRVK